MEQTASHFDDMNHAIKNTSIWQDMYTYITLGVDDVLCSEIEEWNTIEHCRLL